MKKDLLIAGILVVLAGLGIGAVALLPALQLDDDAPKIIKPKPEPIVVLPKKEEPTRPVEPVKRVPVKLAQVEKKKPIVAPSPKDEPEPMPKEEKKPPVKVEPEPLKVEPKKEIARPVAKVIEFDPIYQLNDPEGEYTVKTLSRGKEIELIGKIKTLKILGLNERSVIDATKLVAEEVIFLGNLNGGSKVVLGKTQKIRIRDLNDRAELDASACEAREVVLEGAVNSGSRVKLGATKGNVEFLGEINDRAQIEVLAPEGRVVFKSRSDSVINGDARLTIIAKDVEFAGAINGNQTQLDVTLTKSGSLKVQRMSGGVALIYRKADAGDPELRIDANARDIDRRARLVLEPPAKK